MKKTFVWSIQKGRDEPKKTLFGTQAPIGDMIWLMESEEKYSFKFLSLAPAVLAICAFGTTLVGALIENNWLLYVALGFWLLYAFFFFFVVKSKGKVLVSRPNNYKEGDIVITELVGSTLVGIKKVGEQSGELEGSQSIS